MLPLIPSLTHALSISLTNYTCVSKVLAAVPFDVFMNKVAVHIPFKWKRVGTQMSITPAQIDAIDQQYRGNPDDCYSCMFRMWSPYQTRTWAELIEILCTDQVCELELAREIEAHL